MPIPVNKPVICPVLIGRADNTASLHQLIAKAHNGAGQVALICGEAGVGKSRLVNEIITYATGQGFLLFQGNCFPTDLSFPYAPLLDLLRTFFTNHSSEEITATLGPSASVFYPLLPDIITSVPPHPIAAPSDPEQEKRRLFAALAQFFISKAAKRPLLLVVEDLHWSDESSLEFLHYLARRSAVQPLALLVTYRDDEIHPTLRRWLAQLDRERLAQEFSLARLTQVEVAAMLRAIFPAGSFIQKDLQDSIYALTEGNPFFIEEVLKSLISSGDIVYADGAEKRRSPGELHVPRSIQDAVQQRSEHLAETARHVLLLAAVAGRRFDFTLLQQLTGHDEQQLLQVMKELMAAQLVVEESAEQFAFRHALTREAMYAQLLVRERKALHKTIAETMEQLYSNTLDTHLAELAYHFYAAGAWAKALEYAQRAGDKAQSLYAARTAIEQFTRALDAAHKLATPVPAALYRARGQAYETLGDFEPARSDYELALDIAHHTRDGIAEWQSLMSLGFLWAGRDYDQAGALFHRALKLAQSLADTKLHAHSLNRMGNWHLNIEQTQEALRYHQEALTIFQELEDAHGIAETLDLLGMTSYLGGDLAQGTAYYEQAVALFRRLDNREGLTSSLATMALRSATYQTDSMVSSATSLAEVIPACEMALTIAREIGQPPAEAYALSLLALCLGSQGTYSRAFEYAQSSLAIASEIEHRQWMTTAHCTLGALYRDLLALQKAQEHFEQALSLAREINSLFWIRIATGYLASTTVALRDLPGARQQLEAALDLQTPPITMAQRMMWCASVELALAQDEPERALALTDQLIATAANLSEERNILRVSTLRGEALLALHRPSEAEIALKTARAIAIAQGARSMQWRVALILGHVYLSQARSTQAEQAFSTARTLIEELAAAVPGDLICEDFLRQATALLPRPRPLSPNRAIKQTFGGLTSREREVAALLAQGKSNREIADTLVVNARTIETHVSAILSKLGFSSRAQIAVWAAEKGLEYHSH